MDARTVLGSMPSRPGSGASPNLIAAPGRRESGLAVLGHGDRAELLLVLADVLRDRPSQSKDDTDRDSDPRGVYAGYHRFAVATPSRGFGGEEVEREVVRGMPDSGE